MRNWPSTLPTPVIGVAEEYYKPALKSEFEANYIQTRKTATRGRRKLPLAWDRMTEAQYQILEAFFDANQGLSFTFTHPLTSVTHTCVFSASSLKSGWSSGGIRKDVQCPIEEI